MARSDYEHWNEDADYMWWHEEGKHADADRDNAEAARDLDPEYYEDHPPEGCE